MKSQLYLYKGLRKKYIKDLTQIKELFFEKIEPVFANAEKEARDYQNHLWDNVMPQPCDEII